MRVRSVSATDRTRVREGSGGVIESRKQGAARSGPRGWYGGVSKLHIPNFRKNSVLATFSRITAKLLTSVNKHPGFRVTAPPFRPPGGSRRESGGRCRSGKC